MAKSLDGRLDCEVEAEQRALRAMIGLLAEEGTSRRDLPSLLQETNRELKTLMKERDLIDGALREYFEGSSNEEREAARLFLVDHIRTRKTRSNPEWEHLKAQRQPLTSFKSYVVFFLDYDVVAPLASLSDFFSDLGLKVPDISWQETEKGREGAFVVSTPKLGDLLAEALRALPIVTKAYVRGPASIPTSVAR